MRNDRSKIGNHDVGVSADVELNLTGMKCPIPVLKARRQINRMAPRSVLKVTADDPAASLDFEHFGLINVSDRASLSRQVNLQRMANNPIDFTDKEIAWIFDLGEN